MTEMKLLLTWIIALIVSVYMAAHANAAPQSDKDLENLRRQIRKNTVRMEVIEKTIVAPGEGTNIVARSARASMQEKLASIRISLTNETIRAEIAERLAERRQTRITKALSNLYEEKSDIEAKIADTKYILLRPWLQLKLQAIQTIIDKLDGDDDQ